MMLSLVVLPFALPLAFRGGQALAPLLGIEATPSARAYRIGIGFGVVAVALAFFQLARNESRAAATKAEARVRALENARLRAELAALTAEMNPHLLFNALNTIAALVHDEPDRAEEVVMYLAELYRGSLGSARRSSHALADELRLCDAYLKVERARFGERLRVEMDVAGVDTAAIRVPVLILQPFVENAVKHGVATRAKGGTVKVSAAVAQGRVSLTVEDDGPGFGASSHRGAGRAVDNCRERLSLMYREGAELSLEGRTPAGTPGARVVLRMPIDLPDVPEEAKS